MGRPRADAHLLVLHFKQTIAELYGGNTEDLDVPMNREQAADAAEDIAQMKVALGDGSPSEYRDRLTEYIANAEALLLGLPHTDRNQLTL